MEMYKLASRLKMRVTSSKGPLTVEQLWGLTPEELDSIAVDLDVAYKESSKKSYLESKTPKDKYIKLQRDIVVDILTTLVDERESAQKAASEKAQKQRIMGIIQKKKETELETLSIEELEKML